MKIAKTASNSRDAPRTANGRGCVKTQKHEIFVDRVTIADIQKIA
jgi:hypothetical protein